ncbi:MAG: Grx4 family monothiol glutaredoxin [Chlamydiae bacterium]|nr:Grx4 family monothiol glutaredoxin [Chlamydiota bacterium]MBI3267239.1 Grx4 family monothiol glutaredoxin [Chlamydiota bacterium]
MSHPLRSQIEEKVKSSPVIIFMKGTPEAPQCGFSARACEVLRAAGAKDLASVNVLANDELWDALEDYTQWPTVPQIFIHGEFIGGCDIVTEMYERGELQEMLKQS